MTYKVKTTYDFWSQKLEDFNTFTDKENADLFYKGIQAAQPFDECLVELIEVDTNANTAKTILSRIAYHQ